MAKPEGPANSIQAHLLTMKLRSLALMTPTHPCYHHPVAAAAVFAAV